MSTITTKDSTTIYYKDWGKGPIVTFSHGWPLNSDMWDGQMRIQNGLWGQRPDGTAYGDLREDYCVYSIEHSFWEGRPLDGIGGTGGDQK
jgi:pimeloyl-ACP methyl ester carboxylesterase